MIRSTFIVLCFLGFGSLNAQSFIWGPKGGLTLGMQTWNNVDRSVLIGYHGALYMESAEEGSLGSFFGQIGYHTRGSSQLVSFTNGGGVISSRSRQTFQFNNASLQIGAKKKLDKPGANKPYYGFALRLEYTASTNLSQYENAQSVGYFPLDPFVNKFNYGVSVNFGYEFPFSSLVGGFVEATFSPDLSKQYAQPAIPNVFDPLTRQNRTLPQQTIRNLSFELTVGFRFLRKVIYLDDY